MLYEKPWENLSHKGINTLFGSSQLLHFVDPTTQRTEFPRIYYWQDFQRQVENLSHAEADAIFPKPESPQPVSGTAEIKGDIRGSYLLNSSITPLSDVDIVLPDRETGIYYWQDFQRQVENLSHAEASVIFPKPESPQLVDETADIKEDIRGSYLFNSSMNQLSDVVLAHAETGTAITDFTRLRKDQIGKQKLEISEQFDTLAQREDNWDGRGSQKPTDLTLAHAKEVMGALLDSVISAGHQWDTPSISSDGDGNVTAVWYKNERQLHLQIGEHEAEYFRVWGTNIDTEMDVDFLKPENYLTLWKWLIDEQQLHLQIEEHEAEYFRVWGTNIDTEMDVDFLKPENYLTL